MVNYRKTGCQIYLKNYFSITVNTIHTGMATAANLSRSASPDAVSEEGQKLCM